MSIPLLLVSRQGKNSGTPACAGVTDQRLWRPRISPSPVPVSPTARPVTTDGRRHPRNALARHRGTDGRSHRSLARSRVSRPPPDGHDGSARPDTADGRSEEHTSELQSLMRISYAVFCLKKKKHK